MRGGGEAALFRSIASEGARFGKQGGVSTAASGNKHTYRADLDATQIGTAYPL